MRLIRNTLAEQIQKIRTYYYTTDCQHSENVLKRLNQLVKIISNDKKCKNIIYSAMSETAGASNIEKFDADTNLIPFTNGFLEMNSRIFRPYKPSDLITISLNYDYNPESN